MVVGIVLIGMICGAASAALAFMVSGSFALAFLACSLGGAVAMLGYAALVFVCGSDLRHLGFVRHTKALAEQAHH